MATVTGCGDGNRDENQLTAQPTSASASGSVGTDSATGSGSGVDDGQILDVPGGMGSADDGGNEQGCDKVDFLFVIDNSGSMGDEQANLIANFPQFIDTIKNTLDEAQDYHIMVIDVDAWIYGSCEGNCAAAANCDDGMGVCDISLFECFLPCTMSGVCSTGGFVCGQTTPLECEDVIGAGVTHPRGADATNMDCAFSSSARYIDATEPDLHEAFACAAQVGTGSFNDPEKPMEAMVQAVTPNTEAAACNEGFLRDDAILVVTFITDEDDNAGDGSSGTVEGWRQALVSAKNGDEDAIVVLGLFGDNDQPNAICPPFNEDQASGAEPSPRLRQFVDSFGARGIPGSVCAGSYQDFFQQAVDIIDTTCEEFTPPEG